MLLYTDNNIADDRDSEDVNSCQNELAFPGMLIYFFSGQPTDKLEQIKFNQQWKRQSPESVNLIMFSELNPWNTSVALLEV